MQYDPDMILTDATRPAMVAFLESRGWQSAQLAIMPNVRLANAYHETGSNDSSDVRRVTAAAILAMMESLNSETIIRNIARNEAQILVDNLAPRRIEIISATQTITLNGLVHYETELVIRIVSLNHPTMLVGPAGCGKTTIAEHVAKALGLNFYITNTITETHQLIGFIDGYGAYHGTPFRQAFEFGGVWVADEIDAWEAGALLTANSALANGYCMFPDQPAPITRHPDFRMIATANTFGTGADRVYVGRNELDAATLDRFATIEIDYDLNLERFFAGANDRWLEHVWHVRKRVNELKIRHVVSSRAVSMGSDALRAGIDWNKCEELYLFKSMSKRDRDKIKD